MKYAFDGYNYMVRLEKGELVVRSIEKLVKKLGIKGGSINGLGGLTWAEVGFYELTAKAYAWSRFEEPLELLSISGNISWLKGKPFIHAHATVSDSSQYARGGHLNEAGVNGTVEIFIHCWNSETELERKADKSTGLNLLEL